MALSPNFTTFGASRTLKLKCTTEAERMKQWYSENASISKDLTLLKTTTKDISLKRAIAKVRQLKRQGGNAENRVHVLGQVVVQSGPYTGRSFVWLLSNDLGYSLYIWRCTEQGPPTAFRQHNQNIGDNRELLVEYMKNFTQVVQAHRDDKQRVESRCRCFGSEVPQTAGSWPSASASESSDNLASPSSSTAAPRSAAATVGTTASKPVTRPQPPKKSTSTSSTTTPSPSHGVATFMTPQKKRSAPLQKKSTSTPSPKKSTATPQKKSTATPQKKSISTPSPKKSTSTPPQKSTSTPPQMTSTPLSSPTDISSPPEVSFSTSSITTPPVQSHRKWTGVSQQQEHWMMRTLETEGWVSSTRLVQGDFTNLWYLPPPGQLVKRKLGELPKPGDFQLHPMFVWMPDKVLHLFPAGELPCLSGCKSGGVSRRQLGEPRVVVGSGGGILDVGQYYVVSIHLRCKRCQKVWRADQPAYLEVLPALVKDMFPAHVTYRKRICRSVLDRLMRPGRSPADVAGEVKDLLKLNYERAHLAYLQTVRHVKSAGQGSLDSSFGLSGEPAPTFGEYEDKEGWNGVLVSQEFLVGCLVSIYKEQRPFLYGLMKGTFGKYMKSDHTRTFAKRVEKLSGAMWSYSISNEYQEILSWVLVGGAGEKDLQPCYEGLQNRYVSSAVPLAELRWVDRDCCNVQATVPKVSGVDSQQPGRSSACHVTPTSVSPPTENLTVEQLQQFRARFQYPSSCRTHYNDAVVELLDPFHCMRRFGRACTSEAHPLFGKFMAMLSGAFFVVNQSDLDKLTIACSVAQPGESPNRDQIKRHCRFVIPPAQSLEVRVEAVLDEFYKIDQFSPPGTVPLFEERMREEWQVQRTHIRHACLSDPVVATEDGAGVAYRVTKYESLRNCQKPEARLPVYQTVRGTSQLEGFHPHQAKWVTGNRVSPTLFQAQGMLGVCRWNYQRAITHRHLQLPASFNPKLHAELNELHRTEYGTARYPDLIFNNNETDELFGLEYMSWDFVRHELDAWEDGETLDEDEGHTVVVSVCEESGELYIVKDVQVDAIQSVDNLMSGPDAAPSLPHSPTQSQSPAVSPSQTKISAKAALKKATEAGVEARPVPHENWPDDTRKLIDNLLADETGGKDKLNSVLREYQRRLRASRSNPELNLVNVNMNFLRCYYKKSNRELAQKQAIILGGSGASVAALDQNLRQPQNLSSIFVDVQTTTSAADLAGFSETIVLPATIPASDAEASQSEPTVSQPQVPPGRVREKRNEKSGTNVGGRNCLFCGKPMAKESSWHRKEIKKGQPCFVFCPQQLKDLYKLPSLPESIEQFKVLKNSQGESIYEVHLESLRAKRDGELAAKQARAEAREKAGKKAPGVAKGIRLARQDRATK